MGSLIAKPVHPWSGAHGDDPVWLFYYVAIAACCMGVMLIAMLIRSIRYWDKEVWKTAGVFALTFISGAAYECGCTFWVHYAERRQTWPAVGFSMFNAVVTIIGVESFLKRRLFALAYVIGFGTGTHFAIEVIDRWFM